MTCAVLAYFVLNIKSLSDPSAYCIFSCPPTAMNLGTWQVKAFWMVIHCQCFPLVGPIDCGIPQLASHRPH